MFQQKQEQGSGGVKTVPSRTFISGVRLLEAHNPPHLCLEKPKYPGLQQEGDQDFPRLRVILEFLQVPPETQEKLLKSHRSVHDLI